MAIDMPFNAWRSTCRLTHGDRHDIAIDIKKALYYNAFREMRGYGGIGRRVGFRFRWATVQVQILLSASLFIVFYEFRVTVTSIIINAAVA